MSTTLPDLAAPPHPPEGQSLVPGASGSPGTPIKLDYIPCLDGLRAFACVLVLWEHLPQLTNTRFGEQLEKAKDVLHPGFMGVTIFFVLSGFLITRILLKDKQTSPSFRRFYIKRMLRIFPIYYITLAILTCFTPQPFYGWSALYLQNYYFAFTMDNTPLVHTWSLAVEEHFYMVWPLLVLCLSVRTSRIISCIVIPILSIVLCLISFQLVDSRTAVNLVAHGTHSGMLALSFGAAMAYFEPDIRRFKTARWQAFCGGLIALAVLLLLSPSAIKMSAPMAKLASHWAGSLVSAAVVLALLINSGKANLVGRILEFRPIRFVGTISYGLYLYHLVIYYALGIRGRTIVGVGTALWAQVVVFAVAAISYYVLERPLINLKRHLK